MKVKRLGQTPQANALHALTLLISRQVRNELESLDQTVDFHLAPPLCFLLALMLGSPMAV
jgi:hypothetical protein